MARFTRLQVLSKLAETGLVPVFNHDEAEVCQKVLKACYQGGIRLFEFTNRTEFAHETFAVLAKYAAAHCPDMILGAGTVFDAGTAALYMQLGVNFIVSPVLKEDMAFTCNRRKVAWIPGCATLTEISRAEELGAEVVKVFPGSVLGPEFIKSLRAPMPWTSVMVTGGVEPEEENLKAWFGAGVTAVGMGSQLIPKEVIANKDYAGLEQKVREALRIIQKYRK